jgi:WD40 repeat protein
MESEWPNLLGFQLMADGQSLATNDGTDIIILAIPGGQEIDRFSLNESLYYSQIVGISPTGSVLAVEARDENNRLVSLQFVDLQTHEVLAQVDTLSDSLLVWAFSPDGRYVALGGRGVLRLLDIASDTTVWTAEFSEWVRSVTFIGEDNYLAVISDDSLSIQFYSVLEGSLVGELPPYRGGELPGYAGALQQVRFFPLTEQLLQYGVNGLIQFWKIR